MIIASCLAAVVLAVLVARQLFELGQDYDERKTRGNDRSL